MKTGKEGKRYRLIKSLKPLPTIFNPESEDGPTTSQLKAPVSIPRKSSKKRIFQEEQLDEFLDYDIIKSFTDFDTLTPSGYTFTKYDDHIVYYQMEINELSVPEVKGCIRVDRDLHVKLFFKGSPLPLPQWFRYGRDCRLTRKSMLENFPTYIKSKGAQCSSLFEELRQLRFKKKPIYSADIIRHSLFLRYTSLQCYKILQQDLPLPSLLLLRKLTKGDMDVVKCAKTLKSSGKISDDVILMFDEMYLQKCEKYSGGEVYGADENNELYKGLVCFMIDGMKESVPYVIKSIPEIKINGGWLKEQILDCLNTLKSCGFNVRGIVCDNHSSNVSVYKRLLEGCNQDPDSLFMLYESQKIYLFFDTVHLIKSIRNNLLNYRRFLFPSFSFNDFKDPINFQGGELSWKTFHEVSEKDALLEAHLKKAPKMNSKVLHPGTCKQNVPAELAIFDETTSAAIEQYFPERKEAAKFLRLFNTWWIISNSKDRFSNQHFGACCKKK